MIRTPEGKIVVTMIGNKARISISNDDNRTQSALTLTRGELKIVGNVCRKIAKSLQMTQ